MPRSKTPATGDDRAAAIDARLGKGASLDPSNWALAISRNWITQPSGETYEHKPWPRQPKEAPDA
jgi:hypothetical protein